MLLEQDNIVVKISVSDLNETISKLITKNVDLCHFIHSSISQTKVKEYDIFELKAKHTKLWSSHDNFVAQTDKRLQSCASICITTSSLSRVDELVQAILSDEQFRQAHELNLRV